MSAEPRHHDEAAAPAQLELVVARSHRSTRRRRLLEQIDETASYLSRRDLVRVVENMLDHAPIARGYPWERRRRT